MKQTTSAWILALVVIACGVWWDWSSPQPQAKAMPASVASAPAAAPADSVAEAVSSPDIKTLSDAINQARPSMGDTINTFSDGAQLLVLWASERITWKELDGIPSTKAALVFKDSADELGKRICASGQIIEIAATDAAGDKIYVGELADTDSGTIFRFAAMRSTGSLVEQSHARFCGIVTGRVDYANSMGGESHAIQLVGMFDLPENHKPIQD